MFQCDVTTLPQSLLLTGETPESRQQTTLNHEHILVIGHLRSNNPNICMKHEVPSTQTQKSLLSKVSYLV